MTSPRNFLDRIEITSPCTADWNEMTGTEQIRYCSECHKYVYNLLEMTRREAEALVAGRRDQMCARFTRDLDGKTLTVDSLPPVRLLGWRPGPIATAVVGAMISITPGAAALAKGHQAVAGSSYSLNESGHRAKRPAPGSNIPAITGIVSDEKGAPLTGAIVTLTSEASGEVLSQVTSEEGEFRFESLAPRTYILEIRAKGYGIVKHHDVILQQGEARRFDIAMEKLVEVMGAMGIPSQPLRTLFLESDRIVVAQVGASSVAEKLNYGRSFKTSLMVSQTIKGDGHKPAVDVHHFVYARDPIQFTEGQTVLAFLQRKEGDTKDGYEPIYGASSVKRLSPSDLETYLSRLEELKAIVSNREPNPIDIVEWLVRCAEDPVTRREGSFELQMAAWRQEQADRRTAEGEPLDSAADFIVAIRKLRDQEPPLLLTSEQRLRLMNALLRSEDLINWDNGDRELLEVVKRWNDPRLVPFLISYLRRFEKAAPQDLWRIMRTIAELLKDEKLIALSGDYLDGERHAHLQVEEKEDVAESSSDEGEQVEDETDASSDETDTAVTLTPDAANQVRMSILKEFLEAAEAKIKLTSSSIGVASVPRRLSG